MRNARYRKLSMIENQKISKLSDMDDSIASVMNVTNSTQGEVSISLKLNSERSTKYFPSLDNTRANRDYVPLYTQILSKDQEKQAKLREFINVRQAKIEGKMDYYDRIVEQ